MTKLISEDLYLNRAKFVMKVLGVWVPRDLETVSSKLHRIIMMTVQYLFLFFQIIYAIQVWGDLEAVSQALSLLFTQACLCFKLTVFQVNMGMLKDLLGRMESEIFRPQNFTHEKILKLQATRIKRLLLVFMICSQTSCCFWILKPLFDDTGNRKFPLDMWMPVTPERSPDYQLGYAFQFLAICMSAYMYFGVDSVAFSLVIFGCAQVDIVKEKVLSIKPLSGKNGQLMINSKELLAENYEMLIECVVHHQAIFSFIELVENTYHSYLIFQLTGCVGLICVSAFRMLVVEPTSIQFISLLTYLMGMICQLYVCCWCGHELTATSEDLHTVLYKCPWYEQDARFQRAFRFIMMRTGRPMFLRAGHYISLSRPTFVAILRLSYSYLAVLNQRRPE